jgi:DNA polymerase-1
MAINAPVQGTGADIVKIAMVRVDELLRKEGLKESARLILQVHDELVYEADAVGLSVLVGKIKPVMEGIIPPEKTHGVRLSVEAKAGGDWDTMKPL